MPQRPSVAWLTVAEPGTNIAPDSGDERRDHGGQVVLYPRYDQIQQRSIHNAYSALDSLKDEQLLDLLVHHRIRQLELDLHADSALGCPASEEPDWGIYHVARSSPGPTVCWLSQALTLLASFHRANPRHEVVTVLLELKSYETFRPTRTLGNSDADMLDARIAEILGRDNLFTPADLLGRGASALLDAVDPHGPAGGWPRIDQLRGKFIFVVQSPTDEDRNDYATADNAYRRVAFLSGAGVLSEPGEVRAHPHIVFLELSNDAARTVWERHPGIIIRSGRVNSAAGFFAAQAAGCQLIATDTVDHHDTPWARTHNRHHFPFGIRGQQGEAAFTHPAIADLQESAPLLVLTTRSGDIESHADSFSFAYTTSGAPASARRDQWTAMVASASNDTIDGWGKCFLMARDGLDADARYFAVGRTADDHGIIAQWRSEPGGETQQRRLGHFEYRLSDGRTSHFDRENVHWIRLEVAELEGAERRFTAFASVDGRAWKHVASVQMAGEFRARGLAASAHGAQHRDTPGVEYHIQYLRRNGASPALRTASVGSGDLYTRLDRFGAERFQPGRHVVVEVSASKLEQTFLTYARTTPSQICRPPASLSGATRDLARTLLAAQGLSRLAVWVAGIAVVEPRDVADGADLELDLVVNGVPPPGGTRVPLPVLGSELSAPFAEGVERAFRQFDAGVGQVGFRAVERGGLAMGAILHRGFSPASESDWRTWSSSFLDYDGRFNDWGLFIDGEVLAELTRRRLAEIMDQNFHSFDARPRPGGGFEYLGEPDAYKLESFEVEWGLDGSGALVVTLAGFTVGQGIDFDFEARAIYEFVLDPGEGTLKLERVDHADVEALGSAGNAARLFASDEIQRRFDNATRPDRYLRDVAVRFSGPGGASFEPRRVYNDASGLVVLGDVEAPVPPGPPRLELRPSRVVFYEDPASYCRGDVATSREERVFLSNALRGTAPLIVCEVALIEADGFRIVGVEGAEAEPNAFGTRITSLDRRPVTRIALRLQYVGPRRNASGVLRILCNDTSGGPQGMVVDVQLEARLQGMPTFAVEPRELEIRVANTPDGRARRVVDCELVPDLRPSRPDAPAATVTLRNTSDLPLFLCGARVRQDPLGPFRTRLEPTLVPARSAAAVPVWFYPAQVQRRYEGVLEIDLGHRVVTVPLTGRVDPAAQRSHDALTITPSEAELISQKICGRLEVDACRVRDRLVPVVDARVRRIGLIELIGLPREAEVHLLDGAGVPVVTSAPGTTRREIAVEFFEPAPPEGNPCRFEIPGLPRPSLDGVRVGHAGRLLTPVGTLAMSGSARVLGAFGGLIYAAAEGRLHAIDWSDLAAPRTVASIAVDDEIGAGLARLQAGRPVLDVLTGGRLATLVLDGTELRRIAERAMPPVDGGRFAVLRNGMVAARREELSFYLGDTKTPASTVVLETPVLELTSIGGLIMAEGKQRTTLYRVDPRGRLSKLGDVRGRHWASRLSADPSGRLVGSSDGKLELWDVSVHRLDPEPFAKEPLAYRPDPAAAGF